MEHEFTKTIKSILAEEFGKNANAIYRNSLLIQYLNEKTRSASRDSKSRPSFANLYAVYVLVEDYIEQGYMESGDYSKYQGAQYTRLFRRMRQLPFGEKLQNHALNNRMNSEFEKFFPTSGVIPILRDLNTKSYWINESLLRVSVGKRVVNIANVIIRIIDAYVEARKNSFQKFISQCNQLKEISKSDTETIKHFILGLLSPTSDARLFEIVSFAILKYYYIDTIIYWGFERKLKSLNAENAHLYKTGRTNANDGGIDFVMKPLGRFFQVTETLDFRKYFLDIDKLERYPITFVIKTDDEVCNIRQRLKEDAQKTYTIEKIVEKYMDCIEEIINIPILTQRCIDVFNKNRTSEVLDEIILQSMVEFNYMDPDGQDIDDMDNEESVL